MNRYLSTLLLAGWALTAAGGENLISDSSFEEASSRWKGKDHIVYETSDKKNRICQIEVDKHDDREFYQDVSTSGLKDLIIRYKVKKSADYKGKGYTVMLDFKKRGGVGRGHRIPDNYGWNNVEYRFSDGFSDRKQATEQLSKVTDIRVTFIVKKGVSGSLSFDDIEVIAIK